MLALALVALGGCARTEPDRPARGGAGALVVYRREGGIRFQASTLAVSRRGRATVRSVGCVTRFKLSAGLRRRLAVAVNRTDLSALAGEYPAHSGAADAIAETIAVGPDAVRIGDISSLPTPARRELAPLLGVLGEVLAQGKHRIGDRCSGNSSQAADPVPNHQKQAG